jgi:chromosome segregation ATPase
VEGDNLKEAGFINKSLSALGNVMEALDRKASHVPFRDSKLTYLLQNALGGNSRTMMIVATCPIDQALDESVHALQFAIRVRRIQIGSAQRNINSKNLEETVKTLTDELRSLARAKERTEGQLHSLKRDNARVQDKLSNLSKTRTQTKSDSQTLEVLRKNNDEMAARWQKEKSAREETTEELEKSRKELRVTQQQLDRFKSKLNQLEQKLEDKERALERASENLIEQRTKQSATSVRTRRSDVLGSRATRSSPQNTSIQTPSPTSMSKEDVATTTSATNGHSCNNNNDDGGIGEIRAQVLELLEKYDKAKVDRVDIIMDKFKGKEGLLLDKMRQRYEVGSVPSTTSIQARNEMAMQRHQERMRKIREAKTGKNK